MTFLNLFSGLLFFIFILFGHILIWRKYKPKSEISALSFIFILLPFFVLIGLYFFISFVDLLALSILYYALAGVYIQTFPAFNCEIPSFKILRIIKSSMPEGVSLANIMNEFDSDELINSRTELLEKDKLVIKNKNSGYALTVKGKLLADFFILFRKIYGLPIGLG